MIQKNDVFNLLISPIAGIAIMLLFLSLLALILAFPVMFLWNYFLVPAVSILYPINYLQAWGLYMLSSVLFRTRASFNTTNKKETV